jgi:hypothetical protein
VGALVLVVCSGIFLCPKKGNRATSLYIVPTDFCDELKCFGVILNKTKFVRAFRKLQMTVTLYGCLFVLYLLLMDYFQSVDCPFLLDFESYLSIWPSPPLGLVSGIIILVDVMYIVIYIYFRNAIYRKPGDSPFLVFLEVLSFASRYYFEGEFFNIVWLIPVILYGRSSLTLFNLKQPNASLIQKNNTKSTSPSGLPKYKNNTKDIVLLINSAPQPYDGPPPYGINAPVPEYYSRPPQTKPPEPQMGYSYLFGESDPISTQPSSPSKSVLSSKIKDQEELNPLKEDLITRFRTLNLGNN